MHTASLVSVFLQAVVASSTLQSLRWLCSNGFIGWNDTTQSWTSLPLGKATSAGSLKPQQALIVRKVCSNVLFRPFCLGCVLWHAGKVCPNVFGRCVPQPACLQYSQKHLIPAASMNSSVYKYSCRFLHVIALVGVLWLVRKVVLQQSVPMCVLPPVHCHSARASC